MTAEFSPQDATTQLYDAIPDVLSGHFANFRGLPGIHPAAEDLALAQRLAGVPSHESQVVEMGCGDGRDALDFAPNSGTYLGYGPAEGELALARQNLAALPNASVTQGYAQNFEYPEDTDVIMSVNTVLHVPGEDMGNVFDHAASGLRTGGVLHLITKVEPTYNVEEYPDNFPGTESMRGRTFYHHEAGELQAKAARAGLVTVHNELTVVSSKPWNWFKIALQKQ